MVVGGLIFAVISLPDRCGRQATLHNLAQMYVETLQPNAELESVTPMNPFWYCFSFYFGLWVSHKEMDLRVPTVNVLDGLIRPL